MSFVLTGPNIRGIDKLFGLYLAFPSRNSSITGKYQFYEFMCKESPERKLFLETCCDSGIMKAGDIVILKLRPKG